jgi:hypothetical protein
MFALNLQFSRLDDVIHFPLKAPTLPHPFWGMEEKSAGFMEFLCALGVWLATQDWQRRAGALGHRRTNTTMPLGCGAGCSIYNLVRVFD